MICLHLVGNATGLIRHYGTQRSLSSNTEISAINTEISEIPAMNTEISAINTEISAINTEISAMNTENSAMNTEGHAPVRESACPLQGSVKTSKNDVRRCRHFLQPTFSMPFSNTIDVCAFFCWKQQCVFECPHSIYT